MKPLVFLDVDGVINDLGSLYGKHRYYGVNHVKSHGHTVHIPEFMPKLVQKLVDNNDVYWLTTWRDNANDEIAAALGIDPLPVVTDGTSMRVVSWKPAAAYDIALAALKEGREVWWIEDFYGDIPEFEMPEGVQYVDTAHNTNAPVLLPAFVPKHLLGGEDVLMTRFNEPVPQYGGIFRGALQRMFSFI